MSMGSRKSSPNACVSSSMALYVWPCNCYGPHSNHQPDLLWDLDLYARLARADAWTFIGPINWYGPTSNFKLLFGPPRLHEWREFPTGFGR